MSDEHDAGGPHGMSATVVRLLATVAALAVALSVSSATTATTVAMASLVVAAALLYSFGRQIGSLIGADDS